MSSHFCPVVKRTVRVPNSVAYTESNQITDRIPIIFIPNNCAFLQPDNLADVFSNHSSNAKSDGLPKYISYYNSNISPKFFIADFGAIDVFPNLPAKFNTHGITNLLL
jgi:hypothetical protein